MLIRVTLTLLRVVHDILQAPLIDKLRSTGSYSRVEAVENTRLVIELRLNAPWTK